MAYFPPECGKGTSTCLLKRAQKVLVLLYRLHRSSVEMRGLRKPPQLMHLAMLRNVHSENVCTFVRGRSVRFNLYRYKSVVVLYLCHVLCKEIQFNLLKTVHVKVGIPKLHIDIPFISTHYLLLICVVGLHFICFLFFFWLFLYFFIFCMRVEYLH